MKKTLIAIALLSCSLAYATQREHNCEPKSPPTKSEPPAVSKPEPRGQQSRSDTVDRPCDRAVQLRPLWCKLN